MKTDDRYQVKERTDFKGTKRNPIVSVYDNVTQRYLLQNEIDKLVKAGTIQLSKETVQALNYKKAGPQWTKEEKEILEEIFTRKEGEHEIPMKSSEKCEEFNKRVCAIYGPKREREIRAIQTYWSLHKKKLRGKDTKLVAHKDIRDKGVLLCPNCAEVTEGPLANKDGCACMRNKCKVCSNPVGNVTFTICDGCWDKSKPVTLRNWAKEDKSKLRQMADEVLTTPLGTNHLKAMDAWFDLNKTDKAGPATSVTSYTKPSSPIVEALLKEEERLKGLLLQIQNLINLYTNERP